MSHQVTAFVRAPCIGGLPRLLEEKAHPNRYEADVWIGKCRARWCSELEARESHVLIAIQNSQGRPRCLFEQPKDWALPAEKYVGKDLAEILKTLRFDDRERPTLSDEPLTFETQDMTDRDEPKGVAA